MINANGNYIGFGNPIQVNISGPHSVTNEGDFQIVTFFGSGSISFPTSRSVDYLVVGGGGAGSADNPYYVGGAGGGGGQMVSGSFLALPKFGYQVVVGDGGISAPLVNNLFSGSGGIINQFTSNSVTYVSHTFTSSGQFTALQGVTTAEVLVVGGGGGGATGSIVGFGGEGGGAGGLVYKTNYEIPFNPSGSSIFSIKVGQGGATNQNGQTSSFTPNFVYPGGDTLIGYGGGTGLANGGSGGGNGIAFYLTSSNSGSDGGFRTYATASSTGSAPAGGGAVTSGSRIASVQAPYWSILYGEQFGFGGPRMSILSFIAENGEFYNYPAIWRDPVEQCFDLGELPGTGSRYSIAVGGIDNIQNIRIWSTYAGTVAASRVCLQFSDDLVNWKTYKEAILSNDGTCGYKYLTFITASQIYDGGGLGGDGKFLTLRDGTGSYYAAGGGGGISTPVTNPYTASINGSGKGGNSIGGNGSTTASIAGTAGTTNTGAGGGGGFSSNTFASRSNGGDGGSGIVIVTYPVSGSLNQFVASGSNGLNSNLAGCNFTASFFNRIALGGGGGGGYTTSSYDPTPFLGINGQNGGSGGGAGYGPNSIGVLITGSFGITLAPLGSNGGTATTSSGGGGGGAAGVGLNATSGSGGNGGSGSISYIATGSGVIYAGGGGGFGPITGSGGIGGGGSYNVPGTDFLGGGGGAGADGGKGVVIVRYRR
jgi:hypothetical protein